MVVHAFEGDLGRVRLKVDPDVANPPSGAVFLINGMVAKDFEEEVQPAALFEEILAYLQSGEPGETWLIGPGEAPVSRSLEGAWDEWRATHLELLQTNGRVRAVAP